MNTRKQPARGAPGKRPRPPQHRDERRELKYYGLAACLAVWQQRPRDVIRVYATEETIPPLTPLLKWAAAQRKAYHIVKNDDLERLTESIHHQGVCLLAREAPPLAFADLLALLRGDDAPQLLAYLDGVENPHNLGAILRTCAHFGVRFVLGAQDRLPKLSPSACRVAEGGAEHVALIPLAQPIKALRDLHTRGFQLAAATVHQGDSLYTHRFAPRTVLILGAETEGVSAALMNAAEKKLRIPGSGAVESLNVSVAFALIAGEFHRQRMVARARHSTRRA